MDRGTRNYSIFLSIFVIGLAALFLYEDPKVSELNDLLEADPEISEFRYTFRVVELRNSMAIMSSPRSTQVPVARVLGILFPEVAGRKSQSAEFQKAQKRLATIQTRARDLILNDSAIKLVSWQLDREWLILHGILVSQPH